MPHTRQVLGAAGERAAERYLVDLGYVVLERNWHAGRYGEIDIVAQEGDTLVVVEVKTRHGTGFGNPEDAVNGVKQAKLQGAAQAYLLAHPHLPQAVRIDVVAVIMAPDGELLELKHYRDD